MESKIYNILFGIHGLDENDLDNLKVELKKNDIRIGKTACRYKKMGILKFLKENPHYNVVILSEYLEEKSPYCEQDFEYLADMYEEVMFIPILQNNSNGDGVAVSLYSLGIFTGIYDADANIENIASMLLNGRTRKEAKSYYGIKDQAVSHNSIDYRSTVSFLENAREDALEEMVEHVLDMVNDAEFAIILKMLDGDTYEAIKHLGIKDLVPFFMDETESKEEHGKPFKTIEKMRNKIFSRKNVAVVVIILIFALLFGIGVVRWTMERFRPEDIEISTKILTSSPIPAGMQSPLPEAKADDVEKTAKTKSMLKRKKQVNTGRSSNANKNSKVKRKVPNQTGKPITSCKPTLYPKNPPKRARKKASKKKRSEKIKKNDENIIGIN